MCVWGGGGGGENLKVHSPLSCVCLCFLITGAQPKAGTGLKMQTVSPGFFLFFNVTLGNLRTTTKFTTTTSVDWEKTGTRTSVSAGKRKLKMQSVGRSTTMTLNVNTNVKLQCPFATNFSALASFKTMQDLIF